MRVNTQVILETTDLADNITSDTIELDHIYGYSIYILYTGSGSVMCTTAKLEVSNDGVSWSTYHEFDIEGTADTCTINATDVFYKKARISLVVNAGTISPTMTVYKKGT